MCPFCGEPPGEGVFCAACGRNLAAVERLPTRAEWQAGDAGPAEDAGALAERCAAATSSFLEKMHAAGDPGAEAFASAQRSMFRRGTDVRGWVVRPVDRQDFDGPRRYEPGLVLSVEGAFHQLDSELRGWGQRDFPRYHQTVSPKPVDAPAEGRLIGELAAVLRANA